MSAFDSPDYRQALRTQIKVLKTRGRPMTWQKIAAKIPVQYTFLSKCLNDPTTHLSDDHLFRVCELLEFLPEETEFVLLLRARDVSRQPERQDFLGRQIERLRKQKVVRAEHRSDSAEPMTLEMEYLLDPMAPLVKTSLFLKHVQEAPMRLASLLGLNPKRLKTILEKLEKLGFIELSEDSGKITMLNRKPQHWGRQHPLMRAHQMGMKLHMLDRLRGTEESEKESFFVTFTMDEEGFNEVKLILQQTLKDIQRVSENRRHTNVYQFSLDFLRLF
jgi:hypothetical protein